jgi:hypothetical protein
MPLTDDSPMPFGKHKDKKMMDVPADYLLWLLEQYESSGEPQGARQNDVREYILQNEDMLISEKEGR